MSDWPRYYILVGRTPIAVDMTTWAIEFQKRRQTKETDPWRIALDDINDKCHVSTVFLGLDHSFSDGEPVLFETMVFGGPLDGACMRYQTYGQAEHGHTELVKQTKAQIKTIADLLENATMHTKDKLAAALREAGKESEESKASLMVMADLAAAGHYHDYLSPLATPALTLVTELAAIGTPAAMAIRDRVMEGEFDATAEESDEWAASEEGQELFSKLLKK